MSDITTKQETIIQVVKAAPAVGGATYATFTLNEWAALITILYVFIQTIILLHRHYYFIKGKSNKDK